MTKRENVLSLYRRKGYEWAPIEFSLCPALIQEYKSRTGDMNGNYEEYFDFNIRGISALEIRGAGEDKYLSYHNRTFAEGTKIDSYGVAHEPGSEKAMHMTHMYHPMENIQTINEMKEYPFPEINLQGLEKQKEQTDEWHKKGYAVYGRYEATIWERSWYLRSMPELMCDMMSEDEKAVFLFDKMTEDAKTQCNSFSEAGVDILCIGDDIGMQSSIMMSEELYVKWIKPRLQSVISEAKRISPELLVQYHSCGYVLPFIDHLIEAGIDILNPVQPESMDFKMIHDKYGDVLSFNGTLGTQTTMPFGTPEEVYKKTQENLYIAGDKGGLLCAPTHILEPEVPWKNILKYVQACKDFEL